MARCFVRGCEEFEKIRVEVFRLGIDCAVCEKHVDEARQIVEDALAALESFLWSASRNLFRDLRNIGPGREPSAGNDDE